MATKFDFNAPLYCNAYIAAGISAEAGIVYERLRWMVQDCKGKKTEFGTVHDDGRRWVDFTYAQLYEYLPIFKSVKALRDVMAKLEKAGLIESKSLPRAKWYTISDLDPATLTKIVTVPCQNSSAYPDENRHPIMTKIVTHADENRHPPYNKESESTPNQQSETDTESFYSSDQPPAVAQEEKEIIQFPVSSGIDELILKLAHLTGVNVESNNPLARQIQVTLQGNIRDIKRIDPDVKATDFDRFPEYYQLQKPSRPRPTAGYVVVGWKAFKEWLQANQVPEPVAPVFVEGTLPGVGKVYAESYLWNSVADMRFWESSWLFEAKDESGNEIQFRWVEDRWVSVEQVAQVAS